MGAYHYARPGTDAKAQAAYFAETIKQADATLPPVLDLEETDGLGVTALQNWTRDFLSETQRLTGKTPMIYTYRYFWAEQMGNTKEFSQYPLWLAAWQNTPPAEVPGGWSYMTFWQRSAHGRVSGILSEVDLNLFNGTRDQLEAFAAGLGTRRAFIVSGRRESAEALAAHAAAKVSEGRTAAEEGAAAMRASSPPSTRSEIAGRSEGDGAPGGLEGHRHQPRGAVRGGPGDADLRDRLGLVGSQPLAQPVRVLPGQVSGLQCP